MQEHLDQEHPNDHSDALEPSSSLFRKIFARMAGHHVMARGGTSDTQSVADTVIETENGSERKVEVIGGELASLCHRLDQGDTFGGEVVAYESQSIYARQADDVTTLSEDELVRDYFDFLGDVKSAAQDDDTEAGERMVETVEAFAQETVYLSQSDMTEAVKGLAKRQGDYVSDNPRAIVVYYTHENMAQKSQAMIASALANQTDAHDDSGRVRHTDDPRELEQLLAGKDAADVRVVLADDWSVSGHRLSNDVAQCMRTLDAIGMAQLKQSVEINLVLAREDQLGDDFKKLDDVEQAYDYPGHVPVVAYYRTPAVPNIHKGPVPTGSHSSVDYGFESVIGTMRDYVAKRTGETTRLPFMAAVKRAYRDW